MDLTTEEPDKKFQKKKKSAIPTKEIGKIEEKTVLKEYEFNKETIEGYGEKLENCNLEDLEFFERLDIFFKDILKIKN